MKQEMNCQEVREKIAGLTDGWLEPEVMEQVASHMSQCQACRREAELDLRLVEAVKLLEEKSVPAMRWEPARARRPFVRYLAWLSPAAVAIALVAVLWRPTSLPNSVPASSAISAESQALDHTHMALTLSDSGSDPNRAILAAYSKTPSKERAQ